MQCGKIRCPFWPVSPQDSPVPNLGSISLHRTKEVSLLALDLLSQQNDWYQCRFNLVFCPKSEIPQVDFCNLNLNDVHKVAS